MTLHERAQRLIAEAGTTTGLDREWRLRAAWTYLQMVTGWAAAEWADEPPKEILDAN